MAEIASDLPKPDPASRLDDQLKEADLELKKLDAKTKIAELQSRNFWSKLLSSPLTPILATTLLGFLVSQYSTYKQAQDNLLLEREKLKSSLFLKMIDTDNSQSSAKNLLFLLSIGLIDDPNGKIAALKDNPQAAPVAGSHVVLVPTDASSLSRFFSRYQSIYGSMQPITVSNLTQIFNFISQDKSIQDVRHVAYILATIKYETNGTFAPKEEICPTPDCPPYGPKYKGRGYVSMTWEANYKKLGDLLGVDLVEHPEEALEPDIAYRIISISMEQGIFSGKKLSDYLNNTTTDYVNARRIITGGLDSAVRIAADARLFESLLRFSLGQFSDAAGIGQTP